MPETHRRHYQEEPWASTRRREASTAGTFLFELAAIGIGTSTFAACAGAAAARQRPGTGDCRHGRGSRGASQYQLIGLQLYTVRDQLQTDFEGTVEKIAQIGYKNLEFAGYYNRTSRAGARAARPARPRLAERARRRAAHAARIPPRRSRSAKTIGQDYITLPSYNFGREGVEGWRKGVAEFNTWGAMCRDAGIKLAFHNHACEFAPLDGDDRLRRAREGTRSRSSSTSSSISTGRSSPSQDPLGAVREVSRPLRDVARQGPAGHRTARRA